MITQLEKLNVNADLDGDEAKPHVDTAFSTSLDAPTTSKITP